MTTNPPVIKISIMKTAEQMIAASIASHPYGTSAARAELGLSDDYRPMTAAEERAMLAPALARNQTVQERWDAIYRAAVCAAAEAIQARAWDAKRQALAVADQAAKGRDVVVSSIFGARDVPPQYAPFEAAGANITRDQSSAALKIIAADRAAVRARK